MHALLERVTSAPAFAFLILTMALIAGPKLVEIARLPAMVGLVLAGMVVGPHGLRLLDSHKIALSALGNLGLLYLMFSAGLELDMKLFSRMKKAAITFALLSFALPFTLGLVSAKVLAYGWAAAVLMGSNWGSHTLVTYPILRNMGLARNRAVATVVGATAVTDTSALLVLAAVAVSVKKAGGLGTQVIEIVIGLVGLGIWTLVVLPRIGRWFFARVGTDRSFRLVFGMAALLSGAVLAEAASIDGIVGAFFAGLGMNRVIPERSPLMERVQFLGSALFIPIFLVSVGVLLQPKVMVDPKTLLIALIFTVAVLGGKALAAIVAGRAFHFSWPEIGVMSGLSGSQAAATLATTLVGARLGIFDERTINAVLVVILVSLVATPAMVTFFAKRVPRATPSGEAIGSVVLVPYRGESARPLLGLAARLTQADGGIVLPVSFVSQEATDEEIASGRALVQTAEEWLAKDGLESRGIFRVSNSIASGLLETVRGEGATLLVASTDPEARRLRTPDAVTMIKNSPIPLLFGERVDQPFDRVVVVARRRDLVRPGRLDLELAAEVAMRLARPAHGRRHAPLVLVGAREAGDLVARAAGSEIVESSAPRDWMRDHVTASDLVVLAGFDALSEAAEDLADCAYLVAIGAHGAAQGQPEASASVIVGRSDTEGDRARGWPRPAGAPT